jgi:hypothetical protein
VGRIEKSCPFVLSAVRTRIVIETERDERRIEKNGEKQREIPLLMLLFCRKTLSYIVFFC